MQLAIDQQESVAIITINHESLCMQNAREFLGDMKPLLERFGTVVMDLNQVTFVDAFGMSALLACLHHTNDRDGQFCLCGLTAPVRTLFELVRMHRIFTIYNTIEEALAALTEQEEQFGQEYAEEN